MFINTIKGVVSPASISSPIAAAAIAKKLSMMANMLCVLLQELKTATSFLKYVNTSSCKAMQPKKIPKSSKIKSPSKEVITAITVGLTTKMGLKMLLDSGSSRCAFSNVVIIPITTNTVNAPTVSNAPT